MKVHAHNKLLKYAFASYMTNTTGNS